MTLLTFEQIKELIDLVTERKLQCVEIERSGFRVRIDGTSPPPAPTVVSGPPPAHLEVAAPYSVPGAAGVSAPPPHTEASAEAAEESEESELPEGTHVLDSPIVGTFYAAPSPDAEPYVKAGDSVKKGQVLCIVEAMKLMNEIESDVSGTLLQIYPKNAQPVEYGEPLFAIRPD